MFSSVRPWKPQSLLGGVALAFIAGTCGWTLYTNLAGTHPDIVVTAPQVTLVATRPAASAPTADAPPARPAAPKAAAARRTTTANASLLTAPTADVTLFGKATILPPTRFATSMAAAAPQPAAQAARSVPLPTPRPTDLGLASPKNPTLDALARRKIDDPFEKLFGKRETSAALAYAPADGGVFSDGKSKSGTRLPPNDGVTAIYDIKARTVHLPDGTKLEAHSGLGPKMDDPRYVHVQDARRDAAACL